jgi:hypothetical protein
MSDRMRPGCGRAAVACSVLSSLRVWAHYGKRSQVRLEHLQHIYEEGDLGELATCQDFLQVRTRGSHRVRARDPDPCPG